MFINLITMMIRSVFQRSAAVWFACLSGLGKESLTASNTERITSITSIFFEVFSPKLQSSGITNIQCASSRFGFVSF